MHFQAPKISPLPPDETRPFWSVMIPAYNPRADYLKQTLLSVLQQDPGSDQMQIEVVDDCSPSGPPLDVVRQIAGNRVQVHCETANNGLAGIWNRCIERARGEWVHILHQDDIVRSGFYAALRRGTGDNRVGAAFTNCAYLDSEGLDMGAPPPRRASPGILENWSEQLAVGQRVQCASIVVRRAVYEHLGGFLPQFGFVLDWEMWRRIAAHYAFWYESGVLAAYRLHPASASSRLELDAADTREIRCLINHTRDYLPSHCASVLARQARELHARLAMEKARRLLVAGHPESARKQITEAWLLSRSPHIVGQTLSYIELWLRVAGARLKQALRKSIWKCQSISS
jgi:glycosyltransferase involved in cell wall biosynthesis